MRRANATQIGSASDELLAECSEMGARTVMEFFSPLLEDASLDEQMVLFAAVRLRVEAAIEAYRVFSPPPGDDSERQLGATMRKSNASLVNEAIDDAADKIIDEVLGVLKENGIVIGLKVKSEILRRVEKMLDTTNEKETQS